MDLSKFQKNWDAVKSENRFARSLIVLLTALCLVMACFLFSKNVVVTVVPWSMTQEALLQKNSSNQSYKEAWALAVATMLGNLTPGNVEFVVERLQPLLSPKIFRPVVGAAQEQALQLKEERITQRFEPRSVVYEKSTGKVFVNGYSFASGASADKPVREEKTYEFRIEVANYAPVIEEIYVYQGTPHTERTNARLEQKAEREKARKAAKEKRE